MKRMVLVMASVLAVMPASAAQALDFGGWCAEVAHFSPDLRQREQVLPGITGLWQVEARDNPSFEAYRRLDLFYVENWSIVLDLVIMLGTVEQLVTKVVLLLVRRERKQDEGSAATTVAQVASVVAPQPQVAHH